MNKSTIKPLNYFIKYVILVIILTIVAEGIWFFVIISDYEKLPIDFKTYIEHIGEDQIAYDVPGELSSPFGLRESLIQEVLSTSGDDITIISIVEGVRTDTGEVIFSSEKEYNINRITRMHTDMDNMHFSFLHNVEKKNYNFFHPLIFNDAQLVFQKVDQINGLEVYVFIAETKSNDISFAFPQFAPNIVLSDTFSKLWVEPSTGNILKFEKNWTDYVVVDGTKKIVQTGWKQTTKFTENILTEYTIVQIENLRFLKLLMPIFLGTLFLGVGSFFVLLRKYILDQRRIERKNKLETLGNLTARIAHDIRNPLTVIKTAVDMIKLKEDPSPKFVSYLNNIDRSIFRISHQIDNVLDFVNPNKLKIDNVSLKMLVESSVKTIPIPEGIKISQNIDDVTIQADFNQLEIVLTNIITNAIQALGKTGKIVISTGVFKDKIQIHIEDSGPGISEDIVDKIFDPLFTTKQIGTGLGLLSCKTIIENHGGTITVKNNPTMFTITIPKKLEQNI